MIRWGWNAFERQMCKRKKPYTSKKLAQAAAEKRMAERPGLKLRVYACPLWTPTHWHMTHKRAQEAHAPGSAATLTG